MCGIVGAISDNAPLDAFNGLKALEYRGYDSWGIAFPEAQSIRVVKKTGRIGPVVSDFPKANIAIGHTRWATHGKVTEENAHPHISMNKEIALVHNGIVENFAELKKSLIEKGFSFYSQTDSEVIANMIQDELLREKNFAEAVRKTLLKLEGTFALVILRANSNDLVCARKSSPLVIGLCGKSFFVASDVTAFLSKTNEVVFMEDNSLALISSGNISFLNIKSGEKIVPVHKKILWSLEEAQKGSYPHFMLKEIMEQPHAIKVAGEQPAEKISESVSLIKNAEKVFFTGCGTSFHACLSGQRYFAEKGFFTTAFLASEFSLFENFFDETSLVIALSQSGETADLMEAIKTAKAKGAKVLGIVNVMDSSVMRESDFCLLMNAGPEICVLSTKSYTSQLAVLLLLANALSGNPGKGKSLIEKTSLLAKEFLEQEHPEIDSLAKKLSGAESIFVVGREECHPVALESALKIKEVSYIHAEGFAGGELKHGTIALIDEGTPAIILSTKKTRGAVTSNAIEMKSRGAFTISIGSEKNTECDSSIVVPEAFDANPLLLILPVQLFAYKLALLRGLDPDKPRNLAKSVTVK